MHQHSFSLFLLVEVANFKVDKFNLLLHMLYWKETKEAKIKIANLPDKLITVKLFTS